MLYDNMSAEIAHLRDTFLSAESEYITKLSEFPEWRSIVEEANLLGADELFAQAKGLVDGVEAGMFTDEQMSKVEIKLTILLSAIEDKIKIKVHEKQFEGSEISKGRSR